MDTADKFINNKSPGRLTLFYIVLLILSFAANCFFSHFCAWKITENHIPYVLAAAGGDNDFVSFPGEEFILAGETITEEIGFSRDTSPMYLDFFYQTRRRIFCYIFLLTLILCTAGYISSLIPLIKIYSDMERLKEECTALTECGGPVREKYEDHLSCMGRLADSVSCMSVRMKYLNDKLTAERDFLREFLSDFSHQLKNSLAVIRLNNDILDSMDGLTEEKAIQLSDEINDSIDDMEALIFSALRLAKLNADAIVYEMKEENLRNMCEKSVQKIQPVLEEKNIKLIKEYDRDVFFSFDTVWLSEAFVNLMKNAADHSECTELKISLSETPLSAVVTLSDNGKGIPQSEISELFNRFNKKSNDAGMKSTGIGMSIAEKIIKAHNGDIFVYSSEEKGTRFEVVFLKYGKK